MSPQVACVGFELIPGVNKDGKSCSEHCLPMPSATKYSLMRRKAHGSWEPPAAATANLPDTDKKYG